ncbi:MAG: S-methyl-5-thioribose-1-phosphate isomerase [Caldithrix sp.]|nr:S-methyl-5-thioribose-1-phosphate isomerase [Caldithrix sp.]
MIFLAMNLETITFKNNTLSIIDQQKLPEHFTYWALSDIDDVEKSIKNLHVRGAPAIGIVAAYGLYIHAAQLHQQKQLTDEAFMRGADRLKNVRPTAINLQWAVKQMVNVYQSLRRSGDEKLLSALKKQASSIHKDDKQRCNSIGDYGKNLIHDGFSILTHCNAGILATGGMGTALAPVYKAAEENKSIHVYVDETRPVGQGARLTYWELAQNGVDATLITDNMAASLMQQKKIDLVLVGADRVVKNGDVANKIGTYALAVLAHYHQIPFYVCAPLSTFDNATEKGDEIIIEMRDGREILNHWNINSKLQYKTYNPAFDITPNNLISGIVTEEGIKFNHSNHLNI